MCDNYHQFSFLPKWFALQQLLLFAEKVVGPKCEVDVVYMDFRKAFDTHSHDRLLNKLQSVGITGIPMEVVLSIFEATLPNECIILLTDFQIFYQGYPRGVSLDLYCLSFTLMIYLKTFNNFMLFLFSSLVMVEHSINFFNSPKLFSKSQFSNFPYRLYSYYQLSSNEDLTIDYHRFPNGFNTFLWASTASSCYVIRN